MLLRLRKAQSTAEYAITIGLVVAVVAGILQVALKGGIRQKNKQAMDYMLNSGDGVGGFGSGAGNVTIFSQDYRNTVVDKNAYVDRKFLQKQGSQLVEQRQNMSSTAISVEMVNGTRM